MWITAVVVSLPERGALLAEALDSVHRQHRPPDDVVVGIDYAGEAQGMGETANMNRLLVAARLAWAMGGRSRQEDHAYAFLHDDDLWTPDHLATAERALLGARSGDERDVAVARVTTTGGRPPLVRRGEAALRSLGCDPRTDFSDIMRDNWFPPSAVVARADTFGEWVPAELPPEGALRGSGAWIDWTNWRRLHQAGARFVDTGEMTVYYRFGPWNAGRSWNPR